MCEELTSMKEGGGVVLMVADGRQMEQSELVAAYAAGMVSMSLLKKRERGSE